MAMHVYVVRRLLLALRVDCNLRDTTLIVACHSLLYVNEDYSE